MTRSLDLADAGHGLTTEKQFFIARLVRELDPNLSLRRIQSSDPMFAHAISFKPPRLYGVWEQNVGPGHPNWVFLVAESAVDERIIARLLENDFKRVGTTEAMSKLHALHAANDAAKRKQREELEAERREEMVGIAELARKKDTFRHRIGGRDVIIGDTVRPVRTHQ